MLEPVITVAACLVVALAFLWLAGPPASTDDEPVVWPESPDFKGDAEFFARRRRLEKQQRAVRQSARWNTWTD